MPNAPTRHFSRAFKFKLCSQVRAGAIGRREAQRAHALSGNLIHSWLGKFDRGELDPLITPEHAVVQRYDERIADLEQLVVRLSLDNERLRTANAVANAGNDNSPGKTVSQTG